MSVDATAPTSAATPPPPAPPEFPTLLGHPRPLWMLFMTEFWERFAFYGIRWALTLYIVAQFYEGSGAGEAPANRLYGAYLALVYASALFGGFVADRLIGYQRSLLIGAIVMSVGLFLIAVPNEQIFKIGLATIIAGNGLFKPNVSTMVGKLYPLNDPRRDSGFTIFYMGINAGGFLAPILTGLLADKIFGTEAMPAYKYVFIASGVGMLISLVWFWLGRRQLGPVGLPSVGGEGMGRTLAVLVGTLVAIPLAYGLLLIDASILGWILTVLFLALCGLILFEGIREGKVHRDRAIAMLIVFVFNVMFFMFFEQAGSSFNFLAQNIVERDLGGWMFPVGWFQSVNTLAILVLGPVFVWLWVALKSANPSIPRKFGLGLIFNGLAFALLMYALSALVDDAGKIPFWTLFMVYVIQTVGELCLSPIGLSMTTKLAPAKVVGLAMGGWFLSTAIGNNLSGIFASAVSGETGMTVASALKGYTFGFWSLIAAGVLLLLIAPLVNKLMHGVK
ncbi:peptide MFS transporter [Xanthomonas arboricola]|uniref:Oligopeptide:H+ symporter n=3 Tax=Xanthomonas arboricola pv. pruni TaxID=69929 RepID=A0AAQ1AKV6_9XANT|nr:oligopeptide:H+ symporter [Xanthomonas arboricola]GAE54901.1 di-tripeptide transporter [Xanthomonas arboricola pv. pruni MAFF 301420]GAE62571.1 di-tripeptide transporter [Xanthomonas arboricola pv. pruni MAFF 301427]KCX00514.1 dihydroorotate dehydrogenase [Xanthomonas arboricola pv. pruni]KPN10552.1 dihydroorotate dehydrogenase [Xanthomonas arboricola pv. pruni]MDN0265998.1 oligopeptide:H+ symporter [Xanthomonas arboricola pv. pruni]